MGVTVVLLPLLVQPKMCLNPATDDPPSVLLAAALLAILFRPSFFSYSSHHEKEMPKEGHQTMQGKILSSNKILFDRTQTQTAEKKRCLELS